MITIAKKDIERIELILEKSFPILGKEGDIVLSNNIRVDTTLKDELFKVTDTHIISNAVIAINDGWYKIPYKSDTEGLVAYSKASEQLNNANIEYINF